MLLEEVVQVGAAVRDGLTLGVDRPEVVGEATLVRVRGRVRGRVRVGVRVGVRAGVGVGVRVRVRVWVRVRVRVRRGVRGRGGGRVELGFAYLLDLDRAALAQQHAVPRDARRVARVEGVDAERRDGLGRLRVGDAWLGLGLGLGLG